MCSLARVGTRQVVEAADHGEVLEAGEVLVDRRVLAREADPLPQRVGLTQHVDPGDARRSRIGREERREDADSRRLPGAVRTKQPEDDPALDLQVDSCERNHLAVALAQADGLDRE